MWKFVKSSPNSHSWLDHNFCEIAFIGRSNIGKSSLINALLSQKIAISSKTPGRTQMINFFQKENKIIVDLPGYGYAKISKTKQNQISNNLNHYFLNRKQLTLVCLLISSSIGITDLDKMMIKLLQEYQINFILIATKKDKATQKQIYKTILQMKDYTDQYVVCSIKESKTIELLKDKLNNYL